MKFLLQTAAILAAVALAGYLALDPGDALELAARDLARSPRSP